MRTRESSSRFAHGAVFVLAATLIQHAQAALLLYEPFSTSTFPYASTNLGRPVAGWTLGAVRAEGSSVVRRAAVNGDTTGGAGPGTGIVGNIFDNTAGTIAPGTDIIFTPPYGYALDPGANILNIITDWAGAGRICF